METHKPVLQPFNEVFCLNFCFLIINSLFNLLNAQEKLLFIPEESTKKQTPLKQLDFFWYDTILSLMFSITTQFKDETKIKDIDSNLKGKLEDMLVKHGLTDAVPLTDVNKS